MATPSVTRALLRIVLSAVVATGCGDAAPLRPDPGNGGTGRGGDAAVAATSADAAAARCEVPTFTSHDDALPFGALTATVADGDGDPVADQLAQACGIDVCLARTTDDSGRVEIRPDALRDIRRVAFKYGDGLHYAQFALLLPRDEARHQLGTQSTFALLPGGSGEAFTPGATVRANDVRLTLAEDVQVKLDRLSFPEPEQQRFAASSWTGEAWPDAARDLDLVALWALGPHKTELCPPASLSLPNTPALPAGTELEVLLHVTDIAAAWAEYGTWGRVARASVSEDETRIETLAGEGLPQLGTLGLRVLQ